MTPSILVLIVMAALAVLGAVAFVVMDRGGQLARFDADHSPLDLPTDRPVTGADITRMRLPLALWGYDVRAVDEVLTRMADALQERDDQIAELERCQTDPVGASGERPVEAAWHERVNGAGAVGGGGPHIPYEEASVRTVPTDETEDDAPTRAWED